MAIASGVRQGEDVVARRFAERGLDPDPLGLIEDAVPLPARKFGAPSMVARRLNSSRCGAGRRALGWLGPRFGRAGVWRWGIGKIEIQIDGQTKDTVDLAMSGPRQPQQMVSAVTGLSPGPHTISIVHRGPGPVAPDAIAAQ